MQIKIHKIYINICVFGAHFFNEQLKIRGFLGSYTYRMTHSTLCVVSLSNLNSNFCKNLPRMTLASKRANCFPMHSRWPAENGIYTRGLISSEKQSPLPGSHLAGLKVSGFSKYFGLEQGTVKSISTRVPFLMKTSLM